MSIDPDGGTERQAQVDRMIHEFREAQSRRSAKANNTMVGSKPGADATAALAGSVGSQETPLRAD